MQEVKIIGKTYRVVRPLFQVHSYLYAQVCSERNDFEVQTAALYVYENEDPSQCLKMLREKLAVRDPGEPSNLIFPSHHVKEEYNDKNIALFFISDFIMPLRHCRARDFGPTEFLELLHGGLSSLNQMHMRDIVHGNVTLNSSYLMHQKHENRCRFAFNILDTNYFTGDDGFEGVEEKLFQSEGQFLGQSASYKDDLESLVYVLTHLISRGRLFTVQRFQLEWVTESEFVRWKNCEFFKEMVRVVPPELEILVEIYAIAKSMRRNEKPDYLKLLKKVLNTIAATKRDTRKTISRLGNVTVKQPSLAQMHLQQDQQGPRGSCNSLSEGDIYLDVKNEKQGEQEEGRQGDWKGEQKGGRKRQMLGQKDSVKETSIAGNR